MSEVEVLCPTCDENFDVTVDPSSDFLSMDGDMSVGRGECPSCKAKCRIEIQLKWDE